MKYILISLLLCSLPLTALGNNPARCIGTALIKIIKHLKYTDGQTRSACIANHTMLLHENRTAQKTIDIKPEITATIMIKPLNIQEASLWFKHYTADQNGQTVTMRKIVKPLALKDGSFSELISGSSHDYRTIQVYLSQEYESWQDDTK